MDEKTEHIVMTPKCKTSNSTTLIIERQTLEPPAENGNENNVHIAGGDHKGIVINKQAVDVTNGEVCPAQLCLQFRVFLVSAQTGKHTQEQRTLQFWFTDTLSVSEQPSIAQEFFRELVTPQEFPRDYVGFIKKIMKLMQHKYSSIKKLEIELRQLEEPITLPSRPLSADEAIMGQVIELTVEKVLELIESAYPNPITVVDISKEHGWEPLDVEAKLKELQEKGLIKSLDHGAFTRVVHEDTQIQVVKQMPTMASAKQPTVAIITAQYCEKLAVDSMIENKETFVRYTTVGTASSPDTTDGVPRVICRFGESNVYTLGNIGAHRIVCTKLPTVGHTREAMTAAGNTITRLLGTFQKVDFVFLVGVGGGVPHYTDYNKHVRLGDVVISHPTPYNNKYTYIYCESAKMNENGNYHFETKEYCPPNLGLQEIAASLKKEAENEAFPPWQKYTKEGLENLINQSEHDFNAPPPESDKLYMAIGERDVIEVSHPTAPQDSINKRIDGCSRIHLAPVASGRQIARDDQLRQKFASRFGALAFDAEMDAVVESILGMKVGQLHVKVVLALLLRDYEMWQTKENESFLDPRSTFTATGNGINLHFRKIITRMKVGQLHAKVVLALLLRDYEMWQTKENESFLDPRSTFTAAGNGINLHFRKIITRMKVGQLHAKVVLALLLRNYEMWQTKENESFLDPRSTFTAAGNGINLHFRKIITRASN